MCGIFGLFLTRPLTETDIALGRAGTAALTHRGPDADGEWLDREAGVFIGHRRLSIIDLSEESAQPMVRDEHVLAYNGEIYNYRALRERLRNCGTQFRSTGDTEVLLRAWQRHGPSALDLIDGMFAFVVWDDRKASLAIDRFGEKQLYCARTEDGIYVSSELPPLVRLLRPALDPSPTCLTAFLSLGYIRAPATMYKNIQRLPPGSMATIEHGRLSPFKSYWSPTLPEPGRGPVRELTEAQLDLVQENLIESVVGRLEADVPTCLFLSSGIDSALLAAIIARDLKREVPCITVSYPRGNVLDEGDQATRIAQHLSLEHHIVESQDKPEDIDAKRLFNLFGQLNENVTIVSVEQMARAATTLGCKVGLTGMGGDELFYGYSKHNFFFKHRHIFATPEHLRLFASALMAPFEGIVDKFRTFRRVFGVRDCERYLAVKNLPAIAGLRQLPGFSAWAELVFPSTGMQISRQAAAFDLQDTMANSQMPAFDIGCMQASHELRTPYLNHHLLQTVSGFDARSMIAFGQKSVLQRILCRYLPDELVAGRKHGFRFPIDRFLEPYKQPVKLAGLPAATAERAWARDHESGWQRLKLRSVLASEFLKWHSDIISAGTDSNSPQQKRMWQ